jgi:hypothetical protein
MSATPTDTQARRSGDGDGVHRVLILADAVIGDEALVREIARHTEGRRAAVRIVAPTLVASPLDVATGDVDDEMQEARHRLDASIAALERGGLEAAGSVGEADPNVALGDGLRLFPADEVVIVAHPRERAAWAEQDVVEQARRELTIPITYVEVDGDGDPPAVRDLKKVMPDERERRERADARERVDREAEETFPASDPPANY